MAQLPAASPQTAAAVARANTQLLAQRFSQLGRVDPADSTSNKNPANVASIECDHRRRQCSTTAKKPCSVELSNRSSGGWRDYLVEVTKEFDALPASTKNALPDLPAVDGRLDFVCLDAKLCAMQDESVAVRSMATQVLPLVAVKGNAKAISALLNMLVDDASISDEESENLSIRHISRESPCTVAANSLVQLMSKDDAACITAIVSLARNTDLSLSCRMCAVEVFACTANRGDEIVTCTLLQLLDDDAAFLAPSSKVWTALTRVTDQQNSSVISKMVHLLAQVAPWERHANPGLEPAAKKLLEHRTRLEHPHPRICGHIQIHPHPPGHIQKPRHCGICGKS